MRRTVIPLLLTFAYGLTGCSDPMEKAAAALASGDHKAAIRHYRRAAVKGIPQANERLSEMYSKGQGVPKDHDEAMAWYTKAAEQGELPAQTELGFLYLKGRGPGSPQDYAAALKWLKSPAEKGDPKAQGGLGYLYKVGAHNAPQSYAEALKWLAPSAERGSTFAQLQLAYMFQQGTGVAKDPVKAFSYMEKAAKAGDPEGMRGLGMMYQRGEGVAVDAVEANRWFLAAVSHGNDLARANSNVLQARMTLEQVQEAQRRALISSATHQNMGTGEVDRPNNVLKGNHDGLVKHGRTLGFIRSALFWSFVILSFGITLQSLLFWLSGKIIRVQGLTLAKSLASNFLACGPYVFVVVLIGSVLQSMDLLLCYKVNLWIPFVLAPLIARRLTGERYGKIFLASVISWGVFSFLSYRWMLYTEANRTALSAEAIRESKIGKGSAADYEPRLGGIYCIYDETYVAAAKKGYFPNADYPYLLIKLVYVKPGRMIWRSFMNRLKEPPTTLDPNLDFSGAQIPNLKDSESAQLTGGMATYVSFRSQRFLLEAPVSEYDREFAERFLSGKRLDFSSNTSHAVSTGASNR